MDPTEKQKLAFKKTSEYLGNKGKALKEAGYSESVTKSPKVVTESKGWKKLCKEYLPDEDIAKIHRKLLKKEEVLKEYNNTTKKIEIIKTGQPHSDAKGAVDMAYKIKGKYSAEKKEHTFGDLNSEDLTKELAQLLAGIMTKE